MSCSKIKHNCGKEAFAKCTKYQGNVSETSALFEEECLDVEEVIEDLYTITDEIKEGIDLTALDNECLTLPTEKSVKNLIQFLITTICTLQEGLTTQQGLITTLQEQVADLQENNCP